VAPDRLELLLRSAESRQLIVAAPGYGRHSILVHHDVARKGQSIPLYHIIVRMLSIVLTVPPSSSSLKNLGFQ